MIPVPSKTSAAGMVQVAICRANWLRTTPGEDLLAVEEPLEIRLTLNGDGKRVTRTVSVTMRTPGDDAALAAGFLFTEGIVQRPDQLKRIRRCGARTCAARNVVHVELETNVSVDIDRLERHFYTSSSCGVCGKTSIAAVQAARPHWISAGLRNVDPGVIHELPGRLRQAQAVFDHTGGLHAAALFTAEGELLQVREDVGRHNALDKLIGTEFLADRVPLAERVLLLSGRASFELVQKAMMAGVPVLAAVGAPSSLAVQLAQDCGMTLLGFVREDRFNIYSGEARMGATRAAAPLPLA